MSEKSKRILVPVGFSEQSLKALDHAVIIAKHIKAEIVLLSVVESNSFWEKLFGKERDEDGLKEEALKKLNEIIDNYKDHGLFMETMVGRGEVYEEIARVADLISAELVVMGTNGRPENFNKKMVGSNAFRVVKNVEQPVITIKGERSATEIKTIVFPMMLDRKSKEKVGECLHWARIFGAKVKVVAISNNKEEFKKLTPHVNLVTDFIKDHGVEASSEIIKTKVKSVPIGILNYCNEVNADMIIIMEDEEPGVIRMGGNEVEDVLYNAEIPVMCVTPKPSKFAPGFQAF